MCIRDNQMHQQALEHLQENFTKVLETGSTENTWNNIRQVKCTARDFIRLTRIIKTDSSASTKAKFPDFLNENPNSFHRASLHKKLKELGYSRKL